MYKILKSLLCKARQKEPYMSTSSSKAPKVNPQFLDQIRYVSPLCHKCAGKHFDPTNPLASQKAALEEFGMIPNDCVPSVDGSHYTIYCPYAKKKN